MTLTPGEHRVWRHERRTTFDRCLPVFLGSAFAELYALAGALGLDPGPGGAVYPPQVAEGASEVTAFLATQNPASPERLTGRVFVGELPAQTVAVGVHRGSYASIDSSYRAIGAWVASNAVPLDRAVVEHYLVSFPHGVDPTEFRTEICWPVLPPPDHHPDQQAEEGIRP